MGVTGDPTRSARWPGVREDIGVLVLHGFGSTVQSVRTLAEALAERGWPVSAPLLPGHGETVAAFAETGFPDWLECARIELRALAERCAGTVVVGLSMGGALALTLAAHEPVLGVVALNPYVDIDDPALLAAEEQALAAGVESFPAPGDGDVLRPGAVEVRYQELPVSCLRSLFAGGRDLVRLLPDVTAPLLLVRSRHDAVIGPEAAARIAALVSGPVTALELPRSAHVAPLDHDVDLLISAVVEHLEIACLSSASRPVALEQL